MYILESAGGVIVNEANEVVIVYTNTKSWQLPKGTVEKGEKYLETAIREIKEETGLVNLEYLKELPSYSRIPTHKIDTKHQIHYFLFRVNNQTVRPGAEVKFYKLIPLDEVSRHLTYKEDARFIKDNLADIKKSLSTNS